MDNIVFQDKNFVLTSLNFRNEEIITKLITQAGGKVRSSTVKDTDYIIGSSPLRVGKAQNHAWYEAITSSIFNLPHTK